MMMVVEVVVAVVVVVVVVVFLLLLLLVLSLLLLLLLPFYGEVNLLRRHYLISRRGRPETKNYDRRESVGGGEER